MPRGRCGNFGRSLFGSHRQKKQSAQDLDALKTNQQIQIRPHLINCDAPSVLTGRFSPDKAETSGGSLQTRISEGAVLQRAAAVEKVSAES